jgi:hypothetical protein
MIRNYNTVVIHVIIVLSIHATDSNGCRARLPTRKCFIPRGSFDKEINGGLDLVQLCVHQSLGKQAIQEALPGFQSSQHQSQDISSRLLAQGFYFQRVQYMTRLVSKLIAYLNSPGKVSQCHDLNGLHRDYWEECQSIYLRTIQLPFGWIIPHLLPTTLLILDPQDDLYRDLYQKHNQTWKSILVEECCDIEWQMVTGVAGFSGPLEKSPDTDYSCSTPAYCYIRSDLQLAS